MGIWQGFIFQKRPLNPSVGIDFHVEKEGIRSRAQKHLGKKEKLREKYKLEHRGIFFFPGKNSKMDSRK